MENNDNVQPNDRELAYLIKSDMLTNQQKQVYDETEQDDSNQQTMNDIDKEKDLDEEIKIAENEVIDLEKNQSEIQIKSGKSIEKSALNISRRVILYEKWKRRKFTDKCCAILFILNLLFVFGCAIYGWSAGKIKDSVQPVNSNGQTCGRGDQKNYPNLYVVDPSINSTDSKRVCVKSCPRNAGDKIECSSSCMVSGTYASKSLSNIICMPHESSKRKAIQSQLEAGSTALYGVYLTLYFPVYILAFVLAVATSLATLYALNKKAKATIWTFFIGTAIMIALLGLMLFMQYRKNPSTYGDYKTWAIFIWAIAFIFIFTIVVSRKIINLSIKFIQQGVQPIHKIKKILIPPAMNSVLTFVFELFLIQSTIFMSAVGDYENESGFYFKQLQRSKVPSIVVFLQIAGCLWLIYFIMTGNAFTISSIFVSHKVSTKFEGSNLKNALKWTYYRHFGSISMASIVVLISTLPRYTAIYIRFQLYFYKFLKKICSCLFWLFCIIYYQLVCLNWILSCVEKIFEYASTHTLIEVLLQKKNYFVSIKITYNLFASKVKTVGKVVSLVAVFAKITMVFSIFLNTLICYFAIQSMNGVHDIQQRSGPIFICIFVASVVIKLFNQIIEMNTFSVLHAYCIIKQEEESDNNVLGNELKELAKEILDNDDLEDEILDNMLKDFELFYEEFLKDF